jgi:uncharacterized membrane protein YjjB (DUF3815 family)
MGIISFIFALAEDMLLAAIPAVGFAMVFNVPQRALRWCALLGAIGHGSRMVMMSAGFNIEWATFLAALLVGSIGIQWSRWYLAHPKIFTVAAVIPMFPGISAYTAMISAVKISHFGYSEEMMILLLSNFLKASSLWAPSPLACRYPVCGCIVSALASNPGVAVKPRRSFRDGLCATMCRSPHSLQFRVEIELCLREF